MTVPRKDLCLTLTCSAACWKARENLHRDGNFWLFTYSACRVISFVPFLVHRKFSTYSFEIVTEVARTHVYTYTQRFDSCLET